jgi:hypothetical protein
MSTNSTGQTNNDRLIILGQSNVGARMVRSIQRLNEGETLGLARRSGQFAGPTIGAAAGST